MTPNPGIVVRSAGETRKTSAHSKLGTVLGAVLATLVAHAAVAATSHVATSGNDSHRGTQEQPFASVERAMDAARGSPEPDMIVVQKGSYYLTRPLELDHRDSELHSLKFTDAAGLKQTCAPCVTYPLQLEAGVLRAAFDVRVEPGAVFAYEWRDDPYTYNLGPRLEVNADGWLAANGQRLAQLPHRQ